MTEIELREGSCCPLGATWIESRRAYNFALFSQHAAAVTLLLYRNHDDQIPALTIPFCYPGNKTGRVWHCIVPESRLASICYYAYEVDGVSDAGHRFDREKVLLDPYAKAVVFPDAYRREVAASTAASAGKAPLGVLGTDRIRFDWSGDTLPRHGADLVIYEMHVRGFTRRANSGVADGHRGTFRGVIEKIPYLQDLGVSAVELLPVFQYDPGEQNYWGYMPLNVFSVHRGYATSPDPCAPLNEFREMVKALHAAGIEVILDVVYNHTSEGDERGPTHSYRGLDNATYYLLEADRGQYRNDAGTGNVLNTAHPAVRKLVLDSLRYWATEMHVDGFRFDLASIFSRNVDGSLNLDDPPIIAEITSDPALMHHRLIAEAWDTAAFELGRNFPGITWLQWNSRFRDDVRSFVRGDEGLVNTLISRLYGSDDIFPDTLMEAYRPRQSVNYVTCHDGFCLYDLVSHNQKHNEANGHRNHDGIDDNRSWNCGWEGDDEAPADIEQLRRRQAKNFCCLLFLACGTPMFVAGDEFLHTQRGNNNPYNQDNETTWLDWSLLEKNAEIHRFFRLMIGFRKRHSILASTQFWRHRVRWSGVAGETDRSWWSHSLAFQLDEGERRLYVVVNAYWKDLAFQLPEGAFWTRVIDTGLPSPEDITEEGKGDPLSPSASQYWVRGRSVVVLEG